MIGVGYTILIIRMYILTKIMKGFSFDDRKDLCVECTKKLNRFMAGEDLASTVGNNPIYYVEPKPSVIERFKNKFRKKDKNERNDHHRGCPYSV